ncbi:MULTISPECIES: AAA family ATPase [Methanobacterium]|uniref:AAA family ATPase n=1 Tax=Methanobacterium veterum TaxID=408577 RepID=A0A9E5DPC6_9EURY|nr:MULTISPECIES: AAA family ATPase [Methanobacterium]MCZ3367052.1 AAA family ATPase [Methanobacterium veterum]MCZ3373801.1 AAA family ATPase [Methanobacterium veterum]
MSEKTKVIVVGDVTKDWLKWDNSDSNDYPYEQSTREIYKGYDIIARMGGALLISKMINEVKNDYLKLIQYDESEIKNEMELNNSKDLINSMCILERYNPSQDKKLILPTVSPQNNEKHLVKTFSGFKKPEKIIKPELNQYKFDDQTLPDIVVIHDDNKYFRDSENLWGPIDNLNEKNSLFILKMSRPLAQGDLWEFIKNQPNLIVIIRADDLRGKGLRISRSLSWERTAYDFLNEMEKNRKGECNPDIKDISQCKNLIVRFGVGGAILCQYDGKNAKYTLFFDPEVFEGTLEQKIEGYYMKGLRSAFISGLIHEIQNNPQNYGDKLIDGIKKGIIASRNLLEIGFIADDADKMDFPFKKMFLNLDNDKEKIQDVEFKDDIKWKIMNQKLKNETEVFKAACQYVKSKKSVLLQSPVAEFGKLRTVDRKEIETFHNSRNLILEYLSKKNIKEPLSIAVFGPPGSGKSFGVTQIAKTISDDIEPIEFNLSQFQSPGDLFSAFHIIQSTSLTGKTPLVFFDEFDSDLDSIPYGWLKYFLSPMSDGSFKQGEIIHPIGKCIFVFAGGRNKTFEEFDNDKDKDKVKGEDFISRLRGYIDIAGIDKKQGQDCLYMIRRAMVLRSILERKAKNIFLGSEANIDPSVLNALIKVPKYKHGARSMEAIIEMSIFSNMRHFERSALPSSEQLKLHVNAAEFKKCLNQQINY